MFSSSQRLSPEFYRYFFWGIFMTLIPYLLTAQATINFSGFRWNIKVSTTPAAPGNNFFSGSADNVFVDPEGFLHLKISQQSKVWACVELSADTTFGYGDFVFYPATKLDNLDRNVVLSLDLGIQHPTSDTDPQPDCGVRFTKWGSKSAVNPLVYTVKPTNSKTHLTHFPQFPFVMQGDYSTHVVKWRENHITFVSFHDHGYPTAWQAERWRFPAQAKDSALVPSITAQSKVKIGLWLIPAQINPAIPHDQPLINTPANNKPIEVLIKQFEFLPLLTPPSFYGGAK